MFAEASANDDELAERYVDEERQEYRPRISEWSPTEQLLAALFNRTGEVIAAVIAAAGGKPPHPPDWPAPVTAQDRALRRKETRDLDDLLDLVEQSKKRARARADN